MTERPQVSVLMPVRNGARWLPEAIDSILNQTYSDFEVLVIDDGSTDETPNILARTQSLDVRLRILKQVPSGLVQALNAGLKAAQGRLIARLDADDIALATRVERQVAIFESRKDLVLLGAFAEKIDGSGRPVGVLKPESEPRKLAELLASRNPFIHSSVMFSTEAARACGGYRDVFEAAEDFDLWLRLAERGSVAIVPEVLIRYRVHAEGVTSTRTVRQLFSTRLAIRSAASRRSGRPDVAGRFRSPPDWDAIPEGDELFEDALVSRLLQLADPLSAARDANLDDVRLALRLRLSHRERKVAQSALLRLMFPERNLSFFRIWMMREFIVLHPARAATLLLRLLASAWPKPRVQKVENRSDASTSS